MFQFGDSLILVTVAHCPAGGSEGGGCTVGYCPSTGSGGCGGTIG